ANREDWQKLPESLLRVTIDLRGDSADDRGAQLLGEVVVAYAKGQVGEFFHVLAAYRKLPAVDRKPQYEALVSQLALLVAYRAGKVELFNRELDISRQFLEKELPEETQKARFEAFFNRFAPLQWCSWLYIFVVVLGCLSWLGWAEPLRRAAFWLAMLLLAVHLWALFARMYILERPFVFVTNLYSSALFIGCGCMGLGLILDRIYRRGIGCVAGGFLAFLILRLAPLLAGDGDSLEMMQAVLDPNFWLATHVTVVTLGYTATFLAGGLGIAYILFGVCAPLLNREVGKILTQMTYGILCFATFLSFTGTVLGGIWADPS